MALISPPYEIACITDMVKALNTKDESDCEMARQFIHEDPLSIQVRPDWHNVGNTNVDLAEYEILLCTGGPAVRIIGNLDQGSQPSYTKLQYQDWFTPWIDCDYTHDEAADFLIYAQQFWFEQK